MTSGSISPLYNVPIGMGYVRTQTTTGPGDRIHIRIRGVDVPAELVSAPFINIFSVLFNLPAVGDCLGWGYLPIFRLA